MSLFLFFNKKILKKTIGPNFDPKVFLKYQPSSVRFNPNVSATPIISLSYTL